MTATASKAIAGCFALAAFTVAVLAGLAGGNAAMSILVRALIAMIACYPVGLLIGVICQHVVEQHVREQTDGDLTGATDTDSAEQNAKNAEDAEDVIVV